MTFGLELTDVSNPIHRSAILDPLMAFNLARAPDPAVRPLHVLVREDGGDVVGGRWGRTAWGWLAIELLYLPETGRGRGLGSDVVRMAEREARARGCHGAWVDTHAWQARGFYESLGYAAFGELPDYPTGHSRHFLQKPLRK